MPQYVDRLKYVIDNYQEVRHALVIAHIFTRDANKHAALGNAIRVLDEKTDAFLETFFEEEISRRDPAAADQLATETDNVEFTVTELLKDIADFSSLVTDFDYSVATRNASEELASDLARASYLLRKR